MSPRDKVLAQAGIVVNEWRRCLSSAIPQKLEESILMLKKSIDGMVSEARSRAGNPDTSKQGPTTLQMCSSRQKVLDLLESRPMADFELVEALKSDLSSSGARSRRAELVKMGRVKDSGKRRRSSNGRMHIVWQVA